MLRCCQGAWLALPPLQHATHPTASSEQMLGRAAEGYSGRAHPGARSQGQKAHPGAHGRGGDLPVAPALQGHSDRPLEVTTNLAQRLSSSYVVVVVYPPRY